MTVQQTTTAHSLVALALGLALAVGLAACDVPDDPLAEHVAAVDDLAQLASWRCEANCEVGDQLERATYVAADRTADDAAAAADIACADTFADSRVVGEARCVVAPAEDEDDEPRGPAQLAVPTDAAGPSVNPNEEPSTYDGTLWKCGWHCTNGPTSAMICVSTEPPVEKCGPARIGCAVIDGLDTGVPCYVP